MFVIVFLVAKRLYIWSKSHCIAFGTFLPSGVKSKETKQNLFSSWQVQQGGHSQKEKLFCNCWCWFWLCFFRWWIYLFKFRRSYICTGSGCRSLNLKNAVEQGEEEHPAFHQHKVHTNTVIKEGQSDNASLDWICIREDKAPVVEWRLICHLIQVDKIYLNILLLMNLLRWWLGKLTFMPTSISEII